jgi:hypothetical protein
MQLVNVITYAMWTVGATGCYTHQNAHWSGHESFLSGRRRNRVRIVASALVDFSLQWDDFLLKTLAAFTFTFICCTLLA